MRRPHFYLRFIFLSVLILLLSYSAFGWFAVPYTLQYQLHSVLKDTADWQYEDQNIVFNPFALTLELNQVQIYDRHHQTVVGFERFYIDVNFIDSLKGRISIDEVALDKPVIRLDLDTKGETNFQRDLTQDSTSPPDNKQVDTGTSASLKWQLNSLRINRGVVHWLDNSLKTPAKLTVSNINVTLDQLSQNLSKAFPYHISFSTAGKVQTLSGQVSPDPFAIDGTLAVTQFPLKWLQNYLNESVNGTLSSGTVSVNSDYHLKLGDYLTGGISSKLQIDQFAFNASNEAKPIVSFEKLAIGPSDLQLDKSTNLDIETIRLVKPFAEINIAKDGQINLAQLNTAEASPVDTGSEIKPKVDTKPETKDSFNFAVKQFKLENGHFNFTDASQTPAFSSTIDPLVVDIMPISSNPEMESQISIEGNLDGYGKLQVKGNAKLLSKEISSDLAIHLSNYDLTKASTYAAKFVGYQIDKGKLGLNLNYKIDNSKLKASNHVVLDQFELGRFVDGPNATSLPLPLALGIMKNSKGEIQLDLPIAGNLNDPSFHIGSVVISAVTNLITKIVTSPFAILGALVQGGDDISSVAFLAGQSTLNPQQISNIMKLAKALKDRPKLNLEIRGIADETIDFSSQNEKMENKASALRVLAKNRAQALEKIVIEQGGISKQRVFILDPQVIHSEPHKKSDNASNEKSNQSVTSSFTLSVK